MKILPKLGVLLIALGVALGLSAIWLYIIWNSYGLMTPSDTTEIILYQVKYVAPIGMAFDIVIMYYIISKINDMLDKKMSE